MYSIPSPRGHKDRRDELALYSSQTQRRSGPWVKSIISKRARASPINFVNRQKQSMPEKRMGREITDTIPRWSLDGCVMEG